ncbi:MAG: DUF2807 domain-containing protein [Sphingomonas sp.]|nr:DUF2807 domain-containing protein [Sphingomonas sp.]
MRNAIALGVAAAALAAAGCSVARSEDGGPRVERDYQVGAFDRIELAGAYDTTVRTGSAPSVHAQGNQKAIDDLEVTVKDGVLVIQHKKRMGFGWSSHHRGKVTLTVTVPSLRGAELAGSGDINIDKVAGDSFEGAIAGSGNLKVDHLEVGKLKLEIAGSGNATAGSGRARTAEYGIAGSGGIDAKGIAVETASVSIAGSGDISAHASNTAAVSIMGSGDVELTGGAKCSVSKAGSGQARCS